VPYGILQIVRETDPALDHYGGDKRVHTAFRGRDKLDAHQRTVADKATAEEIVRLIDEHDNKL
jgi:hypothetical protein